MCIDPEQIVPICIFIGSVLLCPLLIWLGKHPIKKLTDEHNGIFFAFLKLIFSTPVIIAFVLVVSWFTIQKLPFIQPYQKSVTRGYMVVFVINAIWFLVDLIDSILDRAYKRSKEKYGNESSLDINLVKTIKKIVSFVLWFLALIWSLELLGVDIAALVTTLGIGGVAVALAAQETVKNLIGGLTILSDKTLRIGDRILANGIDGFVEDIGLRTTKIRALDNRIISIPNSNLVTTAITNVTTEPTRKVVCKLGLTYDTPPAKMKEALAILKALPKENDHITDNITATFDSFGDFSLNILFVYYIKAPRENNTFEETSKVNMAVLEKFNAAGLNFAFPTQTVILDKPE